MPSGELSTRSIVQDAFQRGKDVYIPYIHTVDKVSVMDMLALESIAEFESLQPDKWGIPSLQLTQIPGRRDCFSGKGLDLIVMPGMAFDSGFRRLGHGKGYYDHFLKRYSRWSSKMPFLGKIGNPRVRNMQKTNIFSPDVFIPLSQTKRRKAKTPLL
jgi:5-formyltetrahydrofolate cyclo-ligase